MNKISNDRNFGESVHHFSSWLGAFIIHLSLWGEKQLSHSRPGPGVDQKSLKGKGCFWIFVRSFGAYFCWNWESTLSILFHPSLLLLILKLRQIHWHNPTPSSPKSLLLIHALPSWEYALFIRNGKSRPQLWPRWDPSWHWNASLGGLPSTWSGHAWVPRSSW